MFEKETCAWFFFFSIRFTKKIPIERDTPCTNGPRPQSWLVCGFFSPESFYTIYRSIFKRRYANETATYCRRLGRVNRPVRATQTHTESGDPDQNDRLYRNTLSPLSVYTCPLKRAPAKCRFANTAYTPPMDSDASNLAANRPDEYRNWKF